MQTTLYHREKIMRDLKEIRFVATNFYNLQGLRAVPLGSLLVFVSLWANEQRGPANDFSLPLLAAVGLIILLFAIDRYYLRAFGRVQRTPESRRLEGLIGIVGGILALGAFWLDTTVKIPVSTLGLVFAVGLLTDYIRITWLVQGRYLLYYPLGAVLMAGVSILPVLGATNWWIGCGLKSQMLGIAVAIGLFTIIAGFWGHFFLVHTLMSRGEPNVHTL
jgi:hypothetical protein